MNVTMRKTPWTNWTVRWWTDVLCASKWPDIRVPTEIPDAIAVEATGVEEEEEDTEAVETGTDLDHDHDPGTAGEDRDRGLETAEGDLGIVPEAPGISPGAPRIGPEAPRMDPKARNLDPKVRKPSPGPKVPSPTRLAPPAGHDLDPIPKAADDSRSSFHFIFNESSHLSRRIKLPECSVVQIISSSLFSRTLKLTSFCFAPFSILSFLSSL